jgi:hypothetical protein
MNNKVCPQCQVETVFVDAPVFSHVTHGQRMEVRQHVSRCQKCKCVFALRQGVGCVQTAQGHGLWKIDDLNLAWALYGFAKTLDESVQRMSKGGGTYKLSNILSERGHARLFDTGLVEWSLQPELVDQFAPFREFGLEVIVSHSSSSELLGNQYKKRIDFLATVLTMHLGEELSLAGESRGNGLLVMLVGAPGTGKTAAVKQLSRTKEMPIVIVTGGMVMSKYQGESTRKMRAIFNAAKNAWNNGERFLLYINEVDSLSTERAENHGVSQDVTNLNSEINILLDSYPGIVLVDTNFPDQVRGSHRSRAFEVVFQMPDEAERREFVVKRWKGKPAIMDEKIIANLVARSEGLSFRDLTKIMKLLLVHSDKQKAVTEAMVDEAMRVFFPVLRNKEDPVARLSDLKVVQQHIEGHAKQVTGQVEDVHLSLRKHKVATKKAIVELATGVEKNQKALRRGILRKIRKIEENA